MQVKNLGELIGVGGKSLRHVGRKLRCYDILVVI